MSKNISGQILSLVLATCFMTVACTDKVDLPYQPIDSYTKIYMPAAVNGPVVKILKITDSVQTAVYGAAYGGQGYPDSDIPVTFNVDQTKVDSFNLANKSSYSILPESSYSLSSERAIIPRGQVSSQPLAVSFKTQGPGAMDALKTYILPVSLTSKTVKVNEVLRTTFYLVKAQPDFKDYPNYDRSMWKIIEFSSQEANGEGPDNGRAIFTLDGNTSTFWHSQWAGASPGPPHFLTIDMGDVKILHGLSFIGRQDNGGGKPNEVNVQVSTDNVTWTNAGTFNLQNNQNLQSQFLPNGFRSARYFKIIVNSAYNGSYTHLAEINAF